MILQKSNRECTHTRSQVLNSHRAVTKERSMHQSPRPLWRQSDVPQWPKSPALNGTRLWHIWEFCIQICQPVHSTVMNNSKSKRRKDSGCQCHTRQDELGGTTASSEWDLLSKTQAPNLQWSLWNFKSKLQSMLKKGSHFSQWHHWKIIFFRLHS